MGGKGDGGKGEGRREGGRREGERYGHCIISPCDNWRHRYYTFRVKGIVSMLVSRDMNEAMITDIPNIQSHA